MFTSSDFRSLPRLRKSFCAVLLCLFASSAWAQPFDLLGGKKPRTPKPDFTATITPESVRPGDDVTVSVTVKLPADYYIYGTEKSFEGGTRIQTQVAGLQPLDDEFAPDHAGKTQFEPDLSRDVTKFYEAVTWSRKFRVNSDATGPSVTVNGTLHGQYCSAPEAGGQCVVINPPFRFELTSKLEAAKPAGPVAFATTVRPTRPRQGASAPDPVEYEFRLSPPNANRGDKVMLSVTAWLDAGWHTYSLTQTGLGAAPTEIELDAMCHLKPLGDSFQADHTFITKQSDDTVLEEYHDRVTWSREFEVTGEKAGDYGARGTLTYAVCDARSCLPVKSIEFSLGQVAGSDESPAEPESSPFAVTSVETDANIARAMPEKHVVFSVGLPNAAAMVPKPHEQGLFAFLVVCVIGGFAALLTPCSFPMVPITVSFFLKQSELQHRRPWLLALVYSGTIVLTFTVLGVGIAAIFGATKLTDLANNPWMNCVIGLVFVLFGLNMLGGFEIHIPSQWLTWSASHESTGGYLGAVFMAITFTLTSFTCTFAVAGGLLVMASQGEIYRPVVGMLAFGTAFALPFFVLALAPALLKKLPKSGGWMNAVKVVMGLIEIGAAVKFFSNADMVWNPQPVVFDFVFVMLAWAVLALAIGLYLLGMYRFAHDSPVESISTLRGMLAMGFLGLAGLLGLLILQPERAGGIIVQQIVAFAPPQLKSAAADVGPVILHENGLKFALDLDRAIPVAAQQSRPLLLDFTGVNCLNCRRMEKKMAEPQNKRRIEQFIAVQLYTDKVPTLTDVDEAERLRLRNIERQVRWFGDVSLPSYAIVTPDGKDILAAYVGYERVDGEFTRFLDEGMRKWQAQAAAVGPVQATIVGQAR